MKKLFIILLILSALLLAGCRSKTDEADIPESDITATEEALTEDIVFAVSGEETPYRLVYNVDVNTDERDDILKLRSQLLDKTGVKLRPLDDFSPKDEVQFEIIVNSDKRTECAEIKKSLKKNEYAIKTIVTDNKTSIIIAYNGGYARMAAIEKFTDSFIGDEKAEIPADTDIREKVKPALIESGIRQLRDPCILYADGVYYAYGTGWTYSKNTTGNLDSGWSAPAGAVEAPAEAIKDHWAPEVHVYNGAYYMITTYFSSKTNHRGCTIMKSEKPEGPFREISDGQITPHDWDSIDGTLYIDTDGQPWLVFVHEWTSTDDKVGRFACAKLSDDLSELISEPVEMFRADDPKWANGNVTDGCWMYTTEAGSLLMIWSNWDKYGYCVGIARSESGLVTGPWIQEDKVLYSKSMADYDGGHGMIFTDTDGQKYLSIHSPNSAQGDRREMPVFIPIREENDTLVWDR